MRDKSFYKYIRRQIKEVLGHDRPMAALNVYPDDVFIVSYPRSGNTWMRFLIGNMLTQDHQSTDFTNIEQRVPDIYRASRQQLNQMPRPRFLKSHEPFDRRYRRVIYIVRDPRAVAASVYFFQLKTRLISDEYPFEEFVERFCNGTPGFGLWGEHVGSWLGAREGTESFIMVRYEDLVSQPTHELQRIRSLLPSPVSDVSLEMSVASSSAEAMRDMEQKQTWGPMVGSRRDIPFIRNADTESWREHIPEHLALRIQKKWPMLMERLGYV